MIVKLLTERHLEFLSLKGGYTGSSESTLVKMSNCWKSHALAQNIVHYSRNLAVKNDNLGDCWSFFCSLIWRLRQRYRSFVTNGWCHIVC